MSFCFFDVVILYEFRFIVVGFCFGIVGGGGGLVVIVLIFGCFFFIFIGESVLIFVFVNSLIGCLLLFIIVIGIWFWGFVVIIFVFIRMFSWVILFVRGENRVFWVFGL